jgi:hypothetical protein
VSGVLSEYLFTKKPLIVPVGDDDDWLSAYFKKTGLGDYVYAWRYNELSLQDMLSSIVVDPLRDSRIERREALYHGANSIDELSTLFDNALEMCSLAQKQKALRVQRPVSTLNFSDTPEDAELAKVVKKIRAGTLIVMPSTGGSPTFHFKDIYSRVRKRASTT